MIPNIVDISLPKYINEVFIEEIDIEKHFYNKFLFNLFHNQYGNEYIFAKNGNFGFT